MKEDKQPKTKRSKNETQEPIPKPNRRGGARKFAPPGYYTAKEAAERLGWNLSTFHYYVRTGKIKKYTPPMKAEGFYNRKDIDQLADQNALFLHTLITEEVPHAETRRARPEDAEGIVQVLTMMGWQTTTAEQRRAWYQVNPLIDYVVVWNGEIGGYIWAVPLKASVLTDMMSGRKRSWDIKPEDILPYKPGRSYDLYIGIATRKDIEQHTQRLGFRLIAGFARFLEELAGHGILIRRLYAVSAEEDGQKLCRSLGFVEQEAEPGDLFPRFLLDFETSDLLFARKYREAIQASEK
jgi:hypothetical protein